MLVELGLVEQRYKAVCEVLDGATIIDVAERNGVTRQNPKCFTWGFFRELSVGIGMRRGARLPIGAPGRRRALAILEIALQRSR